MTTRRALLTSSWLLVVGTALAACGSAGPSGSEAVGKSGEALSCGPAEGDWSDFPEGNGTQQCVAGVIEFFANKFGARVPGASGQYGDCAYEGACNIWVNPADQPSSSVWQKHDWGSETAQTYDMVVFPPVGGDPWGHIAVVDHMDGDTLYVMDSNWDATGRKAVCVHTLGGYEPYGFYRLNALAASPARGSLDSVTCEAIAGWAQDPGSKSSEISVELYVDGPKGTGTSLGTVTAGTSRSDLCSALGSCDHAFSVAPPASLYDGHTHSVYAYAMAVTTGAADGVLAQAPTTLHCAAALKGDFEGTGRSEVVEYRDDWTTLPTCGRWGSEWSCNNQDASYVGGLGAGNAGSAIYPGATPLVGDVNGDGRDDVIQWVADAASIPVCFSVEHGWSCENLPATYVGGTAAGKSGSGIFAGATPLIADVNGDGKADLVQYVPGASSIPVCFGTADGWSCENLAAHYVGGAKAGNAGSGIYAGSAGDGTVALMGDVNGDGKADLVQFNPAWSTIPICFSTEHGFSCENLDATFVDGDGAGNAGSGVYPGSTAQLADVNGDGKADLIQFDPSGSALPVCFSSARGWSCERLAANYVGGLGAGNAGSGIYGAATVIVADVNGDGKADVLQYAPGWESVPVCFSTSRGWSCENLSAGFVTGTKATATTTSPLPAGATLLGKFDGKVTSLVQLTPESASNVLPICSLGSKSWSCSDDSATVY